MATNPDLRALAGRIDKVTGKASVTLPPGMTQQEADRLVREADAAQARKEQT